MIGGVDGYKWNITDSYDNNLNQRNNVNNKDELGQKGAVDKSKTTECQTCKNRKYVDGSNEANVSFKNAAHISPEAASSAVRAHEGQHVSLIITLIWNMERNQKNDHGNDRDQKWIEYCQF